MSAAQTNSRPERLGLGRKVCRALESENRIWLPCDVGPLAPTGYGSKTVGMDESGPCSVLAREAHRRVKAKSPGSSQGLLSFMRCV
jgi:hypothetical protein